MSSDPEQAKASDRPAHATINRNVSPSFYGINKKCYTQWYRDTDGYHACIAHEKNIAVMLNHDDANKDVT